MLTHLDTARRAHTLEGKIYASPNCGLDEPDAGGRKMETGLAEREQFAMRLPWP